MQNVNSAYIIPVHAILRNFYLKTGYPYQSIRRLDCRIEISEFISSVPQQHFLAEHKEYLSQIENYSTFEFELLNHGRSVEAVEKELAFLKKNIRS